METTQFPTFDGDNKFTGSKSIFEQAAEAAGMDISPPTPTRVIWKYPLKAEYKQAFSLVLPIGAQFCAMAPDPIAQSMVAWFLVDPEAPEETRSFILTGTNYSLVGFKAYLDNYKEVAMTPTGPKVLVTHLVELTLDEA